MCPNAIQEKAFSIEGVRFLVTHCNGHFHSEAAIAMPSGGVVTIYASSKKDRYDLARRTARILIAVLILGQYEARGVHPLEAIQALQPKQRALIRFAPLTGCVV